MLNISLNRINEKIDLHKYKSWQMLERRSVSKALLRIVAIISFTGFLSLFLPWTQNIRSKGFVTTLRPESRPQSLQSLIGGRIEKWYVVEGQPVMTGDTILRIAESKQDYFDPDLLVNTSEQIKAKSDAMDAYNQKAENLENQYVALKENQKVKLEQNEIKMNQIRLKIQSDSLDLIAARTKEEIAMNQLDRIQSLYDEGIKSLTELETKRLVLREAQAKTLSVQNKINAHNNELVNLRANRTGIWNEYNDKLAKSRSEKLSALSAKYDANATKNKLESQYNAYQKRSEQYYITSPIDGIVTQAVKNGIGELVKAGEGIVTLIPTNFDLAVEMYVNPRDMPLLEIGQKVRVQFDGWPAIVFSGWPNSSYGTFGGRIFAIDNFISKNGKYRILVSQDKEESHWPKEVRVGGGANTITLLKNVRLGYELWRQLNGFPPDYYKQDKQEDIKNKIPLKKVK